MPEFHKFCYMCGEQAVASNEKVAFCAKHMVEALLAKFAYDDLHLDSVAAEEWVFAVFNELWNQMEAFDRPDIPRTPFSRN